MQTMETAYEREAAELMQNLGPSPPTVDILERLYRLGVWSRGSILPRGTLLQPAISRSHDGKKIELLLSFLRPKGDNEIRTKILLVLGQWGGPECLRPIAEILLSRETDSVTRLYCLSAIRNIGGLVAVKSLIKALTLPDTEVQDAAISAIVDLATGGSPSDLDSATSIVAHFGSMQPLSPKLSAELAGALERLQTSSIPLAVRFRAKEALEYLSEAGIINPEATGPASVPAGSLYPRLRLALGVPTESEPGGASAIRIPLIRKDGRKGEVEAEVLPDAGAEGVQPLGNLLYLSVNNNIVVMLRIPEALFPEGIAVLHVSAVVNDGTLIQPEDGSTLRRGGETGVFEFPIPENFLVEWCKRRQFVLTEEIS